MLCSGKPNDFEFKYEFSYNPDEIFSSCFLVLKKIRVGEGEACS